MINIITYSVFLVSREDVAGIHEKLICLKFFFNLQIRVVIHPPGTIPYPFTEGYDVPPGFSASIGIKPVKNIRVGLPHGNCSVTDPFGGGENCANGGSVYRLMSCQKMCLQVGIRC